MEDARIAVVVGLPLVCAGLLWLRLGRPTVTAPAIGSLILLGASAANVPGSGAILIVGLVGYGWFAYPAHAEKLKLAWRRRDNASAVERQLIAAIVLVLAVSVSAAAAGSDALRAVITWVVGLALLVLGSALVAWAGNARWASPSRAVRRLLHTLQIAIAIVLVVEGATALVDIVT